jgi:antitoxin ParD1/3/4
MRMHTVERLSITLPAEMARMIRAKVAAGQYATNSEVIREALRLWQEKEERHQARLAVVRTKIQESLDDPRPSLTEEEVDEHFREVFARYEDLRDTDA